MLAKVVKTNRMY